MTKKQLLHQDEDSRREAITTGFGLPRPLSFKVGDTCLPAGVLELALGETIFYAVCRGCAGGVMLRLRNFWSFVIVPG